MLFIQAKYLTVFHTNINSYARKMFCSLSSSYRKIIDGKIEYENMYWKTEFVGKAFDKAIDLKEMDKIDIIKGTIIQKDDKYIVKVFEFQISDLTKPNLDEQMKEYDDIAVDDEIIFTDK